MAASRHTRRPSRPGRVPSQRAAVGVGRWLALLLVVTGVISGCTATDSSLDQASAVSTPATQPPADSESGSGTPATGDPLQAELDAWVRDPGQVGVTAAVVAPDGRWSGAAGVDGAGEPLLPESAMGVGSVTKTFTAAQVLLLAGEGLVDLDAPITDYVDLPFNAQGATVRHLLSMRSGFPDPTEEVFTQSSADHDQPWSTTDWYALADTSEIGQVRLVGNPRYNNLNYIALTDLIEAVTGRSYADALREDLLDPAGLDRVWVQDAEKPEPPTARGVDDPDLPLVDPAGPWLPSRAIVSAAGGAGSLAADAPSLAAWGWTLYTGRLLAPALVDEMTTAPDDGDYGLGTGLGTDGRGTPNVGHGGDIGAYSSILLVWPREQVSVAVLSPQGSARPLWSLAERLFYAWTDD